jgi:hypothetical protein
VKDAPSPELRRDLARAGLCAVCDHGRRIRSDRGSVFFLCGLSAVDSSFARYPALPVLRCPGFARTDETPDETEEDWA